MKSPSHSVDFKRQGSNNLYFMILQETTSFPSLSQENEVFFEDSLGSDFSIPEWPPPSRYGVLHVFVINAVFRVPGFHESNCMSSQFNV